MEKTLSLRKRKSTADSDADSDAGIDQNDADLEADLPDSPKPDYSKPSRHTSNHIEEMLTVPNDEDDDLEASSPFWTAHYESKGFSPLSLVPPLTWLPAYVRSAFGRASEEDLKIAEGLPFSLKGDVIAGLTVGVMLVPQCLAFALLAGLPVQIGLYSSFAPLLAYALFGTIRQVQPGPTALVSLLTGQALDSLGLEDDASRVAGAALMALSVGVISLLLGFLRFGFIVDFMSHSVMAAFCSAAGITIATSQLKHMFGIAMERKKYWWQTATHLAIHIHETDLPTFGIGGTLLFLLLFLKYWKSAGSEEKRAGHCLWRFFPSRKSGRPFKVMKLVADMSSLLSVLIGWLWGFGYRSTDVKVNLVGDVESDGFKFTLPGDGISDGFDSLFISALVIAVVGYLETIAVGGKFAMQARYEYDANQELVALGMSNIASGFMSGYPGTGSFSRTAVNAMLGASSLVACALASLLVFLAVYILLPVIANLPLASLAPIIIQGAIGVINLHDFVVAWRASKAEFFVMFATFTVSLGTTVKYGLLVGFIFSVLKTMNDLANPNLAVCGKLPDNTFRDVRNFPQSEKLPNAVVVRMDARLSFANSRKMKEFCLRAAQVREQQGDSIQFVVIDAKSINHVDLTGCEMLEMLAESLRQRKQSLIVANLKGPATKCLNSAGVPSVLRKHGAHLCLDMEQALAIIYGQDEDGQKSHKCVTELVKRIDNASNVLKAASKSNMIACRAGQDLLAAPVKIGSSLGQMARQMSPAQTPTTASPAPLDLESTEAISPGQTTPNSKQISGDSFASEQVPEAPVSSI